MKLLWAIDSIHKSLFVFVLYKVKVKRSDWLMTNVCWMSYELMGERNKIAVLFLQKRSVFSVDKRR